MTLAATDFNAAPIANCRYFVTYTGVKLPLRLLNEIDADALHNRNTYFRANYDAAGRLLQVQKMVYGEVEMEHRYRYGEGETLVEAEIIDPEGERTLLRFDPAGNALTVVGGD